MSERLQSEPNPEGDKILDVRILSLGHCETVDEMLTKIGAANNEGKIDVVLMQEFNFLLEKVLEKLEAIKEAAQKNKITIILAPDNRSSKDENFTWSDLKTRLQAQGIAFEKTVAPNVVRPESVGIYIDPTGFAYVFPKTFYMKHIYNPVHRIPNTSIGVTICGEIGQIKPENLEGINILFNPSMEGDDPDLRNRMLSKYGTSTRENIAEQLKKIPQYRDMILSDEEYRAKVDREYEEDVEHFKGVWREWEEKGIGALKGDEIEKAAKEAAEGGRKFKLGIDYSVDERKKRFEEAVDRAFIWKDSHYGKTIVDVLGEKQIPVVRTDSLDSSGILNAVPGMEVSDLKYTDDYARYHLVLKK